MYTIRIDYRGRIHYLKADAYDTGLLRLCSGRLCQYLPRTDLSRWGRKPSPPLPSPKIAYRLSLLAKLHAAAGNRAESCISWADLNEQLGSKKRLDNVL